MKKTEEFETTGVYELVFKFGKAPGQWIYSIDDINSLLDDNNNDRYEWRQWRQGKSEYKPFSLQLMECKESGTLFMEDCCHCGDKLLLCRKYGGQCVSSKCKHERIRKT